MFLIFCWLLFIPQQVLSGIFSTTKLNRCTYEKPSKCLDCLTFDAYKDFVPQIAQGQEFTCAWNCEKKVRVVFKIQVGVVFKIIQIGVVFKIQIGVLLKNLDFTMYARNTNMATGGYTKQQNKMGGRKAGS